MDKNDKKLSEIRKLLEEAESKIEAIKRILFEKVYQEEAERFESRINGKSMIIEGIFDGENMIDKDGKKYLVPQNYCSKSKLVCGDSLKLTILEDGSYLFKQIGPVERKKITGKLNQKKDSWQIDSNGKKYNVLLASVTYFKAKSGDKVTAIIPKTGESDWASIENVLESK